MTDENLDDKTTPPVDKTTDANTTTPPKTESERPTGSTKYYKEELEKHKKQAETLAKQLEEIKIARLKEQDNWKELYESEARKRSEAEEKATNLSQTYVESLKMKEIERYLLSKGIREEALEDIDLIDKSAIMVETTSSGRINFLGVEKWVEDVVQKRPYWFKESKAPIVNNSSSPTFTDKPLSASDLLKLEKENPAKYRELVMKKYFNK